MKCRELCIPVLALFLFYFAGALSALPEAPPESDLPQATKVEIKNVEGTITEVTETGVHVVVPPSENPVRFRFDEKTVYMDERGALIDSETLGVGSAVTIRSTEKAGQLFARTVILHRDSAKSPPSRQTEEKVEPRKEE